MTYLNTNAIQDSCIKEEKLSDEIRTKLNRNFKEMFPGGSLKLFCIEPITITVGENTHNFNANTQVDMYLEDTTFEIIPTSNNSIIRLNGWPGALNVFYDWLNGVQIFDGILFDMNSQEMYTKWNQNNQGVYHVQKAQYINCIFWSDNPYINDIAIRTNYTLYNSFQLPLCYSTIPENTFKPFYLAYGVTSDPNWSNPAYVNSFSLTTTATAPFSYYGSANIGIFDMAVDPILLPKDCRGLMFYSSGIERAGVFDAKNTTGFGAKQGSWKEAFGYCSSLKTLYIQNLKTSINVSWSPLEIDSIEYIINYAINTAAITISVSPYTWNKLSEDIISAATQKNITLALITTNYIEDKRVTSLVVTGDGTSFLANDGTYKTLSTPVTKVSELENDSNYVSVEIAQQMILDTINDLCKWEEGDETPSVPDIPDVPEVPEDTTFGSINDNNEILIDQTKYQIGIIYLCS